MNNKLIAAIIVCLIVFNAFDVFSQEEGLYYQKLKDASGNEILLGKCSRRALEQAPFVQWFRASYDQYTVDTATCRFIEPLLKQKRITIFMGTWCGDSRREVPRILKMLDCCNFSPDQLQLIMVSNQPETYKQSPLHEEAGRNIVRVPTIIVEENEKEKGRIVEYPVVSLEKDLLSILRSEKYVPNYGAQRVVAK
jgi:hypothetical protein